MFALLFCRLRSFPFCSTFFRISYTPSDFTCRSSILDMAMAWYQCWHLDFSVTCSHMCIGPAGARSNHIIVRNTVHGVASGPSRPFSIAKYFFRLARGGLRFSDFHLCTLFLYFPSFPIYVRTCFSWSRRCVCSTVFQGAAAGRYTLGTPREIFEFQFCACDSVNEIW